MEKEFATYEISRECKELGFNERCFAYYDHNKQFKLQDNPLAFYTRNDSISSWCTNIFAKKESKLNACSAPLWQQVIDWLRLCYNMNIISPTKIYKTNVYQCRLILLDDWSEVDVPSTDNYVGAYAIAILKAIEIIKSKTKKGEDGTLWE